MLRSFDFVVGLAECTFFFFFCVLVEVFVSILSAPILNVSNEEIRTMHSSVST